MQASNREGAELERYRREGEGVIAAELSSVRIRGVFSPLVDLIELAGILLVVYFGTRAIAGGGLTLGGMLVFIAYLTRLYGPVRDSQLAVEHRVQGARGRRARDRAARRAPA